MEETIASLLKNDASKYKSILVEKELDPTYDLGHLLATDPNVPNLKKFKENKEEYFKSLTRDNTQLLINKIWELPVERVDGILVAKLPNPTTILPREKKVPRARPPTKWEEYAKQKGIPNRKKSKLVWDEETKEWKPRWGYKRDVVEEKKTWMLEVPQNADPYEDQFAKKLKEKDERVAKNELQRLRNIARSKKIPIPGVGITPSDNLQKDEMAKARNFARLATASVGHFTEMLPKEKPLRKTGKKRKFEPLIGDMNKEKEAAISIVDKIHTKKSKLDIEVALRAKKTNHLLASADTNSDDEEKSDKRNKPAGKRGLTSKRKQKIRSRGKAATGPKKRRVFNGEGKKFKKKRQGGKRR